MKNMNTKYARIIRTIAIIAVVAAFLLICTGCDGGHDAIGYHGPMIMPRSGGIMILP